MGQAKAVVDRLWAALEAQRLEELGAICSPDIAVTMPGGVRLRGVAALGQVLGAYLAAFPDLRHEVVDVVEAGDKIALELRVTGTHTGTLQTPNGPIPATGKPVAWESVDLVTVAGGKIASWHAYYDQLAFLAQLGPQPGPATA
ncbi:MAG TPA: ester cyclase [Thermomicrobiales bacterium]|nr:ester cyclase [Thermomicrobiales bacterium]